LCEARRLPKEKTERGWGQIASGLALVMANLPLYYDAQFRWHKADERLKEINHESQDSKTAKRAKADDKAQEDLERAENQLIYNKAIYGSGIEGQ
jgi:glycine/D-amino acid oxidase-like deaminating enzyme